MVFVSSTEVICRIRSCLICCQAKGNNILFCLIRPSDFCPLPVGVEKMSFWELLSTGIIVEFFLCGNAEHGEDRNGFGF